MSVVLADMYMLPRKVIRTTESLPALLSKISRMTGYARSAAPRNPILHRLNNHVFVPDHTVRDFFCGIRSEIAVPYRTRIRNHVADIAHTREIHHAALKAEAESRMAGRPVFSQIQIIIILLHIHTELLHALY